MNEVYDQDGIALRPTTAYINLAALKRNIQAIRAHVKGTQIMGVVKANAYGHGLIRISQELLRCGVDLLGVAFLEEGIALRRAGIEAPIVVLGGIIGNQIVHFLDFDLQLTASSVYKLEQIEQVAKSKKKRAQVQLKIDTGMERIGVHWDTARALIEKAVRVQHCDLKGVFSHFASAESKDRTYARLQLERFLETLSHFERLSAPVPPRHIANSGAILQHPDSWFEMVRPGLMMYGVYPSPEVERTVFLEPVLSLKTRVVYFKVIRAGSRVSYDSTWTAAHDTRAVTLPVGYGDGYGRGMTGKAHVLINGRRYPVIGRITMDALVVDIGQDSAYNGDEVVLLGEQEGASIRVEDLADWLGTIPYEILTAINTRVPRYYI